VRSDGENLLGFAVHFTATVCDEAGPSLILVISTVRELTIGSHLEIDELGASSLEGDRRGMAPLRDSRTWWRKQPSRNADADAPWKR
jgi:hypothetical protein